MPETETTSDIAALTVQLLSAYLSNNTVAADDLAGLIRTTRKALVDDAAPAQVEPEAPTYTPAVSVRKSLSSPDHILSLIDGKPYKTLKRHLASNGLTPEQYRTRYNLPATYPMVAPTFAARRREIAEQIGLGNKGKSPSGAAIAGISTEAGTEVAAPEVHAAAPVKAKPATKRKPRKAAENSDVPETVRSVATSPDVPAAEPVAPRRKKAVVKSKDVKPRATKDAIAKPTPERKAVSGSVAEPAKPVAKRRGKLGLFKGGEAAETVSEAPADVAPAKTDGKARRARRVARAPKDVPPLADARTSK